MAALWCVIAVITGTTDPVLSSYIHLPHFLYSSLISCCSSSWFEWTHLGPHQTLFLPPQPQTADVSTSCSVSEPAVCVSLLLLNSRGQQRFTTLSLTCLQAPHATQLNTLIAIILFSSYLREQKLQPEASHAHQLQTTPSCYKPRPLANLTCFVPSAVWDGGSECLCLTVKKKLEMHLNAQEEQVEAANQTPGAKTSAATCTHLRSGAWKMTFQYFGLCFS